MARKHPVAAPERVSDVRTEPGSVAGAQGLPIRAHRGWDEAAGVFPMDDPAAQPWFVQRARTRADAGAAPAECAGRGRGRRPVSGTS